MTNLNIPAGNSNVYFFKAGLYCFTNTKQSYFNNLLRTAKVPTPRKVCN